MCNILLSLAALHLHWFQSFYDLNYTTDEICLPYFRCTFPGFNQNSVYIANPHFFDEFLFVEMEQYIEKEGVFTTYHAHLVSRVKQASMKLTHLLHKVTQIAMRNLHLMPHLHLILLLLVPLWLPVQTWQLLILLFLAFFRF